MRDDMAKGDEEVRMVDRGCEDAPSRLLSHASAPFLGYDFCPRAHSVATPPPVKLRDREQCRVEVVASTSPLFLSRLLKPHDPP
jgi:hypothetical protein